MQTYGFACPLKIVNVCITCVCSDFWMNRAIHAWTVIWVISARRHRDPQWNMCGCLWIENYPFPRVTTVQQEVTKCTSPLCSASILVVSALFSVFAPSTEDHSRDYQEETWQCLLDFRHKAKEKYQHNYTLAFKSLKPYKKFGTQNLEHFKNINILKIVKQKNAMMK